MPEFIEAGNTRGEVDERMVGKYTMSLTVMLTGVDAHRIRRFEQGGLLDPIRTEPRQRLFSYQEIELIKKIARLEDQGINMPGILTCYNRISTSDSRVMGLPSFYCFTA